jgi:transposase
MKHRVATAFRLAAQSLHASDTALGHFYRRMRARLGGPAAITATAHKLARIFFHLVTPKEAYDESIFAREEQLHQAHYLKRLKRNASQLGYDLVPRSEPCVS